MKNIIHINYRRGGGLDRESGIVLIMALICLFVISTLAVGVMFSTQSEIWTTANYRATTQARYMAEAGAQQALNYLATLPATTFNTYTTTNFTLNAMPIMSVNLTPNVPLIMSTAGIVQSKYADTYNQVDPALDTAFKGYFNTAVTQDPFGSMAPGCVAPACPHFDVAIQLLTASVGTDGKWLTRWKIISEGALYTVGTKSSSSGTARVQVVEVVDNVTISSSSGSTGQSPTYSAGVFATGTGCGAITMNGGQYTNSYDSSKNGGNPSPPYANTGGDVATYGNVTLLGGAEIMGSVFTPFYNLGATGTYGVSGGPVWPGINAPQTGQWSYGSPTLCSTATGGTEWAVYEDNSGSGGVGCTSPGNASSCSQKTYLLPPQTAYPTPILPIAPPPLNSDGTVAACTGYRGLCAGGNGSGYGVNTNACYISIPPSTLPNGSAGSGSSNFGKVNFGSCAVITLAAGTYNFDSLYISNGAQVVLPATGTVVINILDQGTANPPLSVDGGTVANNGNSPANLTFAYAGSKSINLTAGANMFASIYAPNAAISVGGNAGLYGAVVSKTATFNGSGHVIYDTNLTKQKWSVNTGSTPSLITGALHVDEFSWSAF